ncbi:MAG TPA: hypothetical protein VHB21_20535, partial [Minicystis sp.]|nr:hypothetical protein [Minicystis sp.]
TKAAPNGWHGPAAFYNGARSATAPACDGVAFDLGAGTIDAPPASCTACSCDDPMGQTCGDGALTAYAAANCGAPSSDESETAASSGACQPLNSSTGNDWFSTSPVPATGGSCMPHGGDATVPPARYAQKVRLCTAANAGCAKGSTCFPPPPPGYDDKPCIYKNGAVACDVPGYSVAHTAYAGVDDTRGCLGCSCSDPTGSTCPATTELYDLPGCVTLLNTAHHDGACTDAGGTESFRFTITGAPSGGSCGHSTTMPTGEAKPASPVTVCCAP